MATGNKEITELPSVPDPTGSNLYLVKGGEDFKVPTGIALGLATLGADGKVPLAQLPASGPSSVTWGGITGTLSNQTDLQSALDTKVTTIANVGTGTGTIFKEKSTTTARLKTIKAGSNITITNGTDDITIAASGSGGGVTSISNIGAGEGEIFSSILGGNAAFKTIKAGSGITIANGSSTITIDTTGGAGGGTVTSVGVSGSTGLSVSGSPVTTSGTITLTLSSNLQSWSGITPSSKADTSALSNYSLTTHNHDTVYLKLTGGTLTGTLTATGFNVSSDLRLKKDVFSIQDGNKIYKLNPVSYTYKADYSVPTYGFIAQEVQQVIPEAVKVGDYGYLSVDLAPIVAFLVKAVQDLKEEIKGLKGA